MISALRFMIPLFLAQAGAILCAAEPEPLTDITKIRALSREETAQALPVKLTGVVIYNGWQSFVVHDGTSSIYVDFQFAQKQGVWKGRIPNLAGIIPGAGVEIEGVTDPGGFSPMVLVAKFREIGPMPIPPPLRPTVDELLSSSHDSRWVEVEGVLRKFEDMPDGSRILTLLVGGHSCPVIVNGQQGLTREKLVDARVRVRGVLLNISNLRSQTAGMKLHCSGAQDIDVLVAPPADPFQAPKVALNRLVSYQPDASFGHRCLSEGLVTFVIPGKFFYLLDQDSVVRVNSSETQVAPGDRVEVSGFINTAGALASFSEAMVRKIGTGTVPPPEKLPISEILNPQTRSVYEMVTAPGHPDCNGRLIQMEGVLRRVLPPDKEGNSTAVIETEDQLVYAFLPGDAPKWIEGSLVSVSGVCELEISRIDRSPWFSITGFHMWLSSPAALTVISEPPWWTSQRLALLLLAVITVLGLSLVWGYTMRRRVALRGAQLASEISSRESARLEFETVTRERRRLANDLHDTLEQNLTGLALQLEIANRIGSANPTQSGYHLTLARQFLERSRTETHRTVWDLRSDARDGRGFLNILDERVSAMVAGTGITVTWNHEGDPVPLPDLVAGNLLLLALEAVTNALKHSGAAEIKILLRQTSDHAELVIADNGRGFDASAAPGQRDGHFGLQGMRERTKRLGGEIELCTAPETGTTLRVKVPLLYPAPGAARHIQT